MLQRGRLPGGNRVDEWTQRGTGVCRRTQGRRVVAVGLTPWKVTGPHFLGLWPSWQTPRPYSQKFQRPMRLSRVMCFDCKELPVRTQCCPARLEVEIPFDLMAADNLGHSGPPVGTSCRALVRSQRVCGQSHRCRREPPRLVRGVATPGTAINDEF